VQVIFGCRYDDETVQRGVEQAAAETTAARQGELDAAVLDNRKSSEGRPEG